MSKQIFVRSPDGTIGSIPEEQYQDALNSGYTNVEATEAAVARDESIAKMGAGEAVSRGLLTAPENYDQGLAAKEKILSGFTFGQAPELQTPESRARGQRFSAEHGFQSGLYEAAGQLPYAIAGGVAGGALGAAAEGAGAIARAGAVAADMGLNAAIGGGQVEGEESRLSGEDFSWTDAAITGAAGEVLGRGAVWAGSHAVGGVRNLLARGERDLIAGDASRSLQKGGWVQDYRTAQHAERYQNELADLAAKDLDQLETSFAEVSRQDKKRTRISRAVIDNPPVQHEIAVQAESGMRALRDALGDEIGPDASGPAKKLARQLDARVDALAQGRRGRSLWRTLDENRQALQEYRQDLHQAYENNPGSAWLSREGLSAIDAAEKQTREALLREDAWGPAAAQMQREYNEPFHGKWFPARNTVLKDLHFSPQKDAEGFAVFRGEPAKVRSFLTRDLAEPDANRLGEQFGQYLDGAEAIARAGAKDSPAASRDALEAIRRLRKAQSNAAQISAAARRTAARTEGINHAFMVAGGGAGALAGGPGGAVLGGAAVRGAKVGDWMSRVARKFGWGGGTPESMAALLGRDALPRAAERDVGATLADDIMDRPIGEPFRPSGAPPAEGAPPIVPQRPVDVGPAPESLPPNTAPMGGPSAPPAMPPGHELRPTGVDDGSLPPEALVDDVVSPRNAPTVARVGGGVQPEISEGVAQYDETMTPGRGARATEARRMEALTESEFHDVVEGFRASDTKAPDGGAMADALESAADDLRASGDIVADAAPEPRGAFDARYEKEDLRAQQASPLDYQQEMYDDEDAAGRDYLRGRAIREADEAEVRPGLFDRIRNAITGGRGPSEPPAPAIDPEARAAYLRRRQGPDVDIHEAAIANDEGLQALQTAGIKVDHAHRVSEAMHEAFGRALTPAEWRGMAPVHILSQLGEAEHARVMVANGELIFEAHGPTSNVAPHVGWDGKADEGGYPAQAWRISRSYSSHADGPHVYHDYFYVREDLQNTGVGAKVLKSQMEAYVKAGVKEVGVTADEVGKYFWPSIGFDRPDAVPSAVAAFKKFLTESRLGPKVTPEEAAKIVKGIRSLPSLAQAEHGKDFLLAVRGPWNSHLKLKLDESNPLFHLMRARLDVALGAAVAIGGALEAGGEDGGDGKASAAAASALPLAFAGRAALFRNATKRIVSAVAKRLVSASAEGVVRTTSRLVYSRAQMESRQKEFQGWQSNPQTLVDRVAEGFRDAPPEHQGTIAAGVFKTAAFLKERLPAVSLMNSVSVRQIPVSRDAMDKYARYEQAALTPRDALAEAADSGHISTELRETLDALYPDLLAQLRVEAYLQVRESGPPPTIQNRVSYARLFDGNGAMADPAFSKTVAAMTAYAYEQIIPPKPGPTGGSGTPGVSRVSAVVAAPFPRQA